MAVFFGYVGYLVFLPGNREFTMPDHILSFDSWWYESVRLRSEGILPKWNPFYGLGRVAVQWNQIPVSIYTPLLMLRELTPGLFDDFHRVSTILVLGALYAFGVLLGYRWYLPLLAVVAVVSGPYRFHNHQVQFTTFLLFYPIALALIIRSFTSREGAFDARFLPAILVLAVSFVGIRMETLVQTLAFLALLLAAGWLWAGPARSWKQALIILCAMVLVVIAQSWQLLLLSTAMNESGRVGSGLAISGLVDADSWISIPVHLCRRPELIAVLANLGVLLAAQRLRRPTVTSRWRLAFVVSSQFAAIVLIAWCIQRWGAATDQQGRPEQQLLISLAGLTAVALVIAVLSARKALALAPRLSAICAALWAGFYVAEYSGNFGLLMHPFFYALIPLGVVQLALKRQWWIVVALVAFHVFGEVGSLFLYDVTGVSWLLTRVAIVEVPVRTILLIEGFIFIGSILPSLIGSSKSRISPLFLDRAARFGILTIFLLCLAGMAHWLPASSKAKAELIRWQQEPAMAYHRSNESRLVFESLNSRQRRLNIAGVHDFMPAYSRSLNNAAVYASEVPTLLKRMFAPQFQNSTTAPTGIHPEASALLRDHIRRRQAVSSSYHHDVLVEIERPDALAANLAATVKGETDRAFVTYQVIPLANHVMEVENLRARLAAGKRLRDAITTSDRRFISSGSGSPPASPLSDSVHFVADAPEYVALKVDSAIEGHLVLMDQWSPGWIAKIDGKEVVLYRGYVGTRFVSLPAGSHLIEFSFHVRGWELVIAVSWAAWIVLVALALLFLKRRPWPKPVWRGSPQT